MNLETYFGIYKSFSIPNENIFPVNLSDKDEISKIGSQYYSRKFSNEKNKKIYEILVFIYHLSLGNNPKKEDLEKFSIKNMEDEGFKFYKEIIEYEKPSVSCCNLS